MVEVVPTMKLRVGDGLCLPEANCLSAGVEDTFFRMIPLYVGYLPSFGQAQQTHRQTNWGGKKEKKR
jgi:hypothetical protein